MPAKSVMYQLITVDGVELAHTFRGHYKDIEVYAYQAGPKTYSLFKKQGEAIWRCDWAASYQIQPIELQADPKNLQAMLTAFVQLLKKEASA